MRESIIQSDRCCYFCGGQRNLERHHVFGGAHRKKSDRLGLTVWLCHTHHNEPPYGVHFNRRHMDWLRAEGQKAYEEKLGTREDFMREFGRNYL